MKLLALLMWVGQFGFSAGSVPVREDADGTIRFTAPSRGFYPVEAFYGKDALSLLAANAPVALDCSGAKVFQTRWGRDDVAANFHSEGGTVSCSECFFNIILLAQRQKTACGDYFSVLNDAGGVMQRRVMTKNRHKKSA